MSIKVAHTALKVREAAMAAGKIRNAKETVNVVKKVIKHRSELVKAGSNAAVVVGSKKVAKESINHIQEKRDKGSK